MNISISHQARKLVYFLSLTGLLWGARVPPSFAQVNRTEIVKIRRDRPENVVRYRRDWEVARRDQVLSNGNWLATSTNSMAWMWYTTIGILYRQGANTTSQFVPDSQCGFRVSAGTNLFFDSGRIIGCSQVAGNVRVDTPSSVATGPWNIAINPDLVSQKKSAEIGQLPPSAEDSESNTDSSEAFDVSDENVSGYLVFRNSSQQSTIVAALATAEQRPIIVSSRFQPFRSTDGEAVSETVQLQPGEFVFVLDDGTLTKGEFSLRHFYDNSPLALGLGDSVEDFGYVDTLELPGERELFEAIRTATLSALREQPSPGAFELRDFGDTDSPPDLFPGLPGERIIIEFGGSFDGPF